MSLSVWPQYGFVCSARLTKSVSCFIFCILFGGLEGRIKEDVVMCCFHEAEIIFLK